MDQVQAAKTNVIVVKKDVVAIKEDVGAIKCNVIAVKNNIEAVKDSIIAMKKAFDVSAKAFRQNLLALQAAKPSLLKNLAKQCPAPGKWEQKACKYNTLQHGLAKLTVMDFK